MVHNSHVYIIIIMMVVMEVLAGDVVNYLLGILY